MGFLLSSLGGKVSAVTTLTVGDRTYEDQLTICIACIQWHIDASSKALLLEQLLLAKGIFNAHDV